MPFVEVLLIIIMFTLFGFSHTILASEKTKEQLVNKLGTGIAFYRLFYNLSSILFFVFIWYFSPRPDVLIYDLQYPYDIIIFGLQFISLFGLLWAASYVDIKEFLGLSQIIRYFNDEYDVNDKDEIMKLKINGPFKLCRHPIYFFSILFLALRPTMDLFYLTFFISSVMYFVIGSYYEEKKLVEKFGVEYVEYQKTVYRIIPKIF